MTTFQNFSYFNDRPYSCAGRVPQPWPRLPREGLGAARGGLQQPPARGAGHPARGAAGPGGGEPAICPNDTLQLPPFRI